MILSVMYNGLAIENKQKKKGVIKCYITEIVFGRTHFTIE
jgi:hypothetical protein